MSPVSIFCVRFGFFISKKGCSVFLFPVLTFSDISRVGFSYKRAFAEESPALQGTVLPKSKAAPGNEMNTSKGHIPLHPQTGLALPYMHWQQRKQQKKLPGPSCLLPPPALCQTPAPVSPGLNPELTTAGVQSCAFNFFIFRSKTHLFQGILSHRERHSAPQHHTYCSCSHCKEWNHQWPSAQHLKPPYFTEQRKP